MPQHTDWYARGNQSSLEVKNVERVGSGGALHMAVLRAAATLSLPMRGRGLGRMVEMLARVFGKDRHARAEVHKGRSMEVSIGDGYWMPVLLGRPYEPEVGEALEAALTPESLFLDLGANLGYWSLYASTIIRDPSRIIAVEASPQTATSLEHNAENNDGCFTPIGAAVWSVAHREIEIAGDPSRHAWTSANADVVERLGAMGFERISVPTTTIDELCGPFDVNDVVIKIDLEGAEIEGLKGAAHTLKKRDCVIIFERHERESGDEAQTFLETAGYIVRPLNSRTSTAPGRNFLAVRPGSKYLR